MAERLQIEDIWLHGNMWDKILKNHLKINGAMYIESSGKWVVVSIGAGLMMATCDIIKDWKLAIDLSGSENKSDTLEYLRQIEAPIIFSFWLSITKPDFLEPLKTWCTKDILYLKSAFPVDSFSGSNLIQIKELSNAEAVISNCEKKMV